MSAVATFEGEPVELHPGDCLAGRYRILSVLGSGGMATVYKATDLRLKRDVAIKVVLPELRKNWKTLQRFMREAQAMAALDSPRVVPVYDVGQDGDRYFMVMKLIDAPSLADLLELGAIPEHRALALVASVVEGLRDLHAKGIVHRDVKPSNVVVEDGDRPMLLDFGIVLEVGEPSLTQEGMLVGTPHYMAPEQIFTPTQVDGRADLYAVGVLLFEVLTGRLPYQGRTPQALMQSHISDDVPDPKQLRPSLSRATTAIVRRALTKDLTKRFQNADQLLDALRAVVPDDPAYAETEDLEPEETEGPAPRDHFVLAVIGAVLLAIAAYVIVSPPFARKPQPIVAEVIRPLVPPPAPPPPADPEPTPAPPPDPPPALEVHPRPPPRRRSKPVVEREVVLAALPSNDQAVKEAQGMVEGGDLRGAIRALTRAIQQNPSSPAPYPTLGDAYALTGNKIAAIAAYRRYLALSPHGKGAKRVEAALARLGGR